MFLRALGLVVLLCIRSAYSHISLTYSDSLDAAHCNGLCATDKNINLFPGYLCTSTAVSCVFPPCYISMGLPSGAAEADLALDTSIGAITANDGSGPDGCEALGLASFYTFQLYACSESTNTASGGAYCGYHRYLTKTVGSATSHFVVEVWLDAHGTMINSAYPTPYPGWVRWPRRMCAAPEQANNIDDNRWNHLWTNNVTLSAYDGTRTLGSASCRLTLKDVHCKGGVLANAPRGLVHFDDSAPVASTFVSYDSQGHLVSPWCRSDVAPLNSGAYLGTSDIMDAKYVAGGFFGPSNAALSGTGIHYGFVPVSTAWSFATDDARRNFMCSDTYVVSGAYTGRLYGVPVGGQVGFTRCECDPGYIGFECELPRQPTCAIAAAGGPCPGNECGCGYCVVDPAVDNAISRRFMLNPANVASYLSCSCFSGYYGAACVTTCSRVSGSTTLYGHSACVAHGTCDYIQATNYPFCRCEDGYFATGYDSKRWPTACVTCANGLNGQQCSGASQGTCVQDSGTTNLPYCKCQQGWAGSECDIPTSKLVFCGMHSAGVTTTSAHQALAGIGQPAAGYAALPIYCQLTTTAAPWRYRCSFSGTLKTTYPLASTGLYPMQFSCNSIQLTATDLASTLASTATQCANILSACRSQGEW